MNGKKYLVLMIVVIALLSGACSNNQAPEEAVRPTENVGQVAVDEVEGVSTALSDSVEDTSENSPTAESDPESTEPQVTAQAEDQTSQSLAGQVPAPDFPPGLDWLNSERPLTLADLRGKVVLLDFWTYGCINCLHIIPELTLLEEKYAEELVVIGVHSAKFENEGETENIRRIIQRYELHHPVVNDNRFQIWSLYGARAWPTLVLIDPDGNVLGYHAGEGIYDQFDYIIGRMIAEFDALGRIDRRPLEFILKNERSIESPLLFPGKILADEDGDRLYIADSNHNRIVVTDLVGNVLDVIGDGRAKLQDGDFETAGFFRPQGLSLDDDNNLYVADTENHAIRRVDLDERIVETVAGTGQQVYLRITEAEGISTALNSPWDVLFHEDLLYIAMAGQHQIWVFDPGDGSIKAFAGSGREELADGLLNQGGLNQPSGLATDGDILYIADSEASAIRTADLGPDGRIETIVGTGLFDFGDVDGVGDEVRLQHPLGVVTIDGVLYVADTYNSRIKIVNPDTRESSSVFGGNESGWRDGQNALFDEPGITSFESPIWRAGWFQLWYL
jgi:thiol-disulfide isomerase/thioredoxin